MILRRQSPRSANWTKAALREMAEFASFEESWAQWHNPYSDAIVPPRLKAIRKQRMNLYLAWSQGKSGGWKHLTTNRVALHRTESCMAFAAYTENQGSMKQYSNPPLDPLFCPSCPIPFVYPALRIYLEVIDWNDKTVSPNGLQRHTPYQTIWSGIGMYGHGQGISIAYIPISMGPKRLVFRPRHTLGIGM